MTFHKSTGTDKTACDKPTKGRATQSNWYYVDCLDCLNSPAGRAIVRKKNRTRPQVKLDSDGRESHTHRTIKNRG